MQSQFRALGLFFVISTYKNYQNPYRQIHVHFLSSNSTKSVFGEPRTSLGSLRCSPIRLVVWEGGHPPPSPTPRHLRCLDLGALGASHLVALIVPHFPVAPSVMQRVYKAHQMINPALGLCPSQRRP